MIYDTTQAYPRDLIGLIMQNVEIEREHVGDIRVLDNYSFVQVITEDAQKIIDALNEFEYRGRKLVVSFCYCNICCNFKWKPDNTNGCNINKY